ncbi:MAG: tryptophan 7-halogenase [Candidatus Rokuibacteriota bacterium]
MSEHLIVVPVFNEVVTIGDIVERARLYGPVLVVDDGSTDRSATVAAAAGAEVVSLGARRGKGAALRHAFDEGLRRGVERVVTLDGDGQHDPEDIPHLLKAAVEEPGALVIGGRLAGLEEPPARVVPAGRLAAIRVAGFFIDWLGGVPVADTQSGFRVYPARLLSAVTPRHGGFVLESEMLLHAATRGFRIIEIPITPIHFEDRRSRFRPARDGLAVGAFLAGRIVGRWARESAAGARYLVGIFSSSRLRARHREMYEFAAPHRSNGPSWALAVGAFIADRAIRSVEYGWRSPHARGLRLAGLATAATPLMLPLALSRSALAAFGVDCLTPAARRFFRQEDLARILEAPARRVPAGSRPADYDVLVVGGGPGGSSAATFLSRGGLTVALAEREAFPRFHVGESLLPCNIPVLERIGVLGKVKAHGFIAKYGAYFHDQDMDLGHHFLFREGKPWPSHAYEVPRGEFDKILLEHAAGQPNVTLLQPATVERVTFDADGVTARVADASGTREIRSRFLVDASGRDSFLASRHGQRRPIPGLGKVALFAHFRGGRRWPGPEEGDIRVFIFPAGWFWYIPFHNGTTSVGCVLHARTARGRAGNLEQLYEFMITQCHGLKAALGDALRITDVHSAANFSYRTDPAIGDRFLCVGDALAFVDPIFSSGVYVSTQSAEMASVEILKAFRENRFGAHRFRGYQRRVRNGIKSFQRFIRNFYDPSFVEIFLKPRDFAGMVDGVIGVLAGGAFVRRSLRLKVGLEVFFTIVRINRWVRRRRGLTTESRLEW